MPEKASPTLLRISKIFSNFFNPLTSLIIYFVFYSSQHYTFKETAAAFFPVFLIVVIPISMWIFYNVRKGHYTNMDVSNRIQRKSLYFFIQGVLVLFLLYDYLFNNHIDLAFSFILVLLLLLQISNYFIKSSMHTAFNIFVAALFFAINPLLGSIWFAIGILVGISRIILKRHTPKEVFSGALIALLVSFIYLYMNIQIQNL